MNNKKRRWKKTAFLLAAMTNFDSTNAPKVATTAVAKNTRKFLEGKMRGKQNYKGQPKRRVGAKP